MSNIVHVQSALKSIPYQGNEVVVNEVAVDDREGRLATRGRIENFMHALRGIAGSDSGNADELNQNGLKEYFVDGVYVRSLFIPAGQALVSQLWKRERFWLIAFGEVTFTHEYGTQRVRGPFTKIVPPGSRVALYTHDPTLWFAIAAADATNSKEAEDELIAKDYTECVYPWTQLENSL